MNKEDVLKYLRKKTGYVKKGSVWLADRLGIRKILLQIANRLCLPNYEKQQEL